ncbi:MAG TPA: FAD-dependent oxidoreductase [Baekduia sp.]|uniref:FAD-dependent oxidoreductase n=1 Tax=Baekduia sp. TaxID=2600305 RepID=UPI002D79A959|nr:FAD-dependent oxidoreductase [Baekduia sp.]HET6507029.1 FAD-dependent oxidoreductase [Baekduia sp.]
MRDVAVIGSGAAGLTAALAARKAGAKVTVHERWDRVGGTTALSGGNAWLPANRFLPDDTPELALAYLRAVSLGDANDELLEVFAHDAARAASWLEEHTPIAWQPIPYTDYHAELEGGREQGGRTLEPQPLDTTAEVRALVCDAPNVTAPITYAELAGAEIDREALRARAERGTLTLGRGLVAGLLEACLDAGVEVVTGTRLRALPTADAVVLATGGFERDAQLCRAFLRGPLLAPVGAPTAEGDGLRMAMTAGAALGNMSEAWWCPAFQLPGEEIDGAPMSRLILTERARKGCLIVDGSGRRFIDEAQNYSDFGRTMLNFEATSFSFPHLPAWLIFDAEYRSKYRVGPLGRRDPDPDWLAKGADLGELADAIGVPADALEATVARFSEHAARGEDPDFGRGTYPYDKFIGELGPLGDGPYYALKLLPGALSTKGGPRTDADGRVLSAADGTPIDGLFAAGNVAASLFGFAYPGAGGTLGPILTFGLRAGAAAGAGA